MGSIQIEILDSRFPACLTVRQAGRQAWRGDDSLNHIKARKSWGTVKVYRL